MLDIVRASYDLCNGRVSSEKEVVEGSQYLKRAEKRSGCERPRRMTTVQQSRRWQGWQAQFYGDYTVSTARYRQALDLWRRLPRRKLSLYCRPGHLLLGDADASAGQLTAALAEIKQSLAILDRSVGRQNSRIWQQRWPTHVYSIWPAPDRRPHE